MKGKGKVNVNNTSECPLQFPDLQPVDHSKQCLRYTIVLSRSEDESIGLDELDVLQTDLETLLASAGKRLRQLETEIQILVNWQDKKDKKGVLEKTPESTPPPPTSGKRGKVTEEKPSKKFKDNSGKGSLTPAQMPGRPKVKPNQGIESPIDLPRLPKNDAVNRFWTSVEPYCAEITNDDLKLLEELLLAHEDDEDYFKIPSLGRHYSEKWAQEDLLDEKREGSKISDKRRSMNNNTTTNCNEAAAALLKKTDNSAIDDSPFGPLTQRLVSALIEENIMTPLDDSMADIIGGKESVEEASAISPKALAKQLNIGNPAQLEKRIKRELEEQGIIECDDKYDDNPDDEILMELKKKQQELQDLSKHNILVTKRLYQLAKEEIMRQELRKKLTAADAEVMEAYRKVQNTRLKKKTPTKKEKESVWKCLKERDAILKTLEEL